MKQAVFIINSLQSGGAERVVATQANGLQRAGFEVTILLLHRRIQYALEPGVRVVCLTGERAADTLSNLVRAPRLVHGLNRELDAISRRGEVALITSNLPFPHIVTRLSRYGKKAIYTVHSLQDIVPFARHPAYRALIRWLYQGRPVATISDAVRNELRTVYGISGSTMRTIYNPLDFDELDAGMAEPVDRPRPFLLYCRRLDPVKRPEWVIEVFRQGGFSQTHDLVLLGEGPLRRELEQRVKSYGLEDSVYFAGWQKNVYKWMHAASAMLITSKSEGLSMVLAEALYCGCPVVSVRCTGPEELLKGPLAAYVCEPGVEALVETTRRALRDYPADLRRFVQPFSSDENIRRYLAMYRDWKAAP